MPQCPIAGNANDYIIDYRCFAY